MPELKRQALGWALALACLKKPGTTFGNLKHYAGQPGPGGRMMSPNHEKSSHSRLLAGGARPLARRADVSVRAVRRSRDETLPKCSEISRILDKRSETRDCVGQPRECYRGADVARTMICMSDFAIAATHEAHRYRVAVVRWRGGGETRGATGPADTSRWTARTSATPRTPRSRRRMSGSALAEGYANVGAGREVMKGPMTKRPKPRPATTSSWD